MFVAPAGFYILPGTHSAGKLKKRPDWAQPESDMDMYVLMVGV